MPMAKPQYIDEPIGKLYGRARKGLEILQKADPKSPVYAEWLGRLFGVWGHFLERLEWLESIQMFGDKNLMEDEKQEK